MKRLVLALLLLASSAEARIRYGAPAGGTDYANATSPGAAVNLGSVNTNASSGDSILLANGDYGATLIAPTATGVKFFGNKNSPASVIVAGVTMKADMRVSAVRVSASVSMNAARAVLDSCSVIGSLSVSANNDTVTYCNFNSPSGELRVTPCVGAIIENNTFNHRQFAVECNCQGAGWCICQGRIDGLKFRYNVATFNFTCGALYEGPTFFKGLDNSEIAYNFFDLTIGSGCVSGNHFRMIYHSMNDQWHDNFWRLTNNAMSASLYARHMRDSTRFQTFVRDTLSENYAGIGHAKNTFSGSGNDTWLPGGTPPTVKYSRTDSCLIDLGGEAYTPGSNTTGHSATGNVFVSRSGRAMDVSNDLDTLVFEHNTLVTANDNQPRGAFNAQDNYTREGWTFRSNILYTLKTSTAPTDVVHYEDNGSVFSGLNSLWASNLYWAGAGSSEPRANNACYRSDTQQSLQQFFTNTNREGGSRFASPRWIDSTSFAWARGGTNIFLPTIDTNSLFGPDGYVGAFNADASPADVTPPGQINDLSGAPLSATRALLAWTQAGDDGFGNGPVSIANIRRAASQITNETQWNAATLVGSIVSGSLSSPGEQQSYTDNTVSASTTYWYAVRCDDDAGNTGALGNSVSVTTPAAADVTAPSAVADLTATNIGIGAVRLTWTAPGNDGVSGTASSYDMRRRTAATFVDADFSGATTLTGEPVPAVAGTVQTMTVTGLANSTQYAFALKTSDATGNVSAISNAAVITTQAVSVPFPAAAASSRGLPWAIW